MSVEESAESKQISILINFIINDLHYHASDLNFYSSSSLVGLPI